MFENSFTTKCPKLYKFVVLYKWRGNICKSLHYYPGGINRNFILRDMTLKILGGFERDTRIKICDALSANECPEFELQTFYQEKTKTEYGKEVFSHIVEYGIEKVDNQFLWELTGYYSIVTKFPNL